jgi:hypothetical protein
MSTVFRKAFQFMTPKVVIISFGTVHDKVCRGVLVPIKAHKLYNSIKS